MRKKKTVKRTPKWWRDVPTSMTPLEKHEDDRGSLVVFASESDLKTRFGSVAVITSKAGTERANHSHKKDSHICYVVSGEIEYFERPTKHDKRGIKVPPIGFVFKAGDTFFTPPGVDHTMRFTKDTTFVTVGDRHRTQKDYEKDLIRFKPSLAQIFDEYLAETK